jgi:hypothetical protein
MKDKPHVYFKGSGSPFRLYETLYEHLHEPFILDDADELYSHKDGRPLLKAVCESRASKVVMWQKKLQNDLPHVTRSRVCIICNEWRTVGGRNLEAVADRAIAFHFDPTAAEVHRQVDAGGWFKDREAYDFIGEHLRLITALDAHLHEGR